MVTGPRSIDFIVVGTPRSGTTLVQRLASELPGVALPAETHFLSLLGEAVVRREFPLDADGLQDVMRDYLALPTSQGIEIDAEAVVRGVGGRASSIFDVFSAIVDASTQPAATVGEKTPITSCGGGR